MKNKLVIALLIITAFWTFSAISNKSDNSCINVYVDYGSMNGGQKVISCIDSDHKEQAIRVLESANISINGTDKYGLQVVCRVNNFPKPEQESCATMPPENAYWAVIVKQNTSGLSMQTKWNWAQTGISDVYLEPGDSIGLVFTENEKVKWPD